MKVSDNMATLYELSEKYLEVLNSCDDSDTDIAAALTEIEDGIEEKVKWNRADTIIAPQNRRLQRRNCKTYTLEKGN
jgi:hypothetical protein